MANNYNVTPQEAQELEEKKRREEESKAKANAQKAVASVKGVTGDVVANWAKPKEGPKSYPYKQQEQSSTSIWQPNQIEMPTLKSVEDAYANRKFSADNIRTEGAKRRKSNMGSTTKERAKALEKKFPEYKNLTSFGIKTPEQYLNTGGDENKYADYVFDIVSKKHDDYFDSIDTSNAETVSGDMYAKEYGDAYNEALKMRNKAKYYRAETFDRNRQQAVNMWGLPDVTKADGFYNRGTQHVAPSVAKASLENYSKGGNVDLTDRTVFDGSNIKQFGWDVKDGEAVTTLTNTYTSKDGSVAMNFTPIGKKADGSYFVLTPDELTQYAEAVAEGAREDDLGLKIGKTFEGANAVKKATEEADRIHTLQEDYYLNGQLNSELNKLGAMTAEHNKGYPWKDTFDYTLDKYVSEQKQEADEKQVNSLADQSRKIAFLFEEQKKTAPASQSADYDKVIKQFKGQADAYDNLSTTLEDYMVNQSYYGYDEKSFNDFKKLESEIRDTVLKNYENPEGLSDKAFASIKNTDGVLANGDMPFDLSAELLSEDAYNKTAMSKNKSYNEYLFEEGYRRLEAINNAIETYNVYYTENPKTQEDKNRNALYEKLEGARYDVSERMREIADYIDTDARIKAGSAEGMTIDQWNKLEDKPYKTYNEYLYYLGEDKGSAQKRDDMYTAISKVGVLRHDTRFASLSKDEQDKLTSQRNSLTARARGVAEILNSFEEAEKNTNASYKESFGGSFDANYALGWLNDEVSDAWNTYYETGDAEALRGAKAMSKVQEDFVAKHSKALEHDSGWAANLISHSLASYLPQKLSQLESAAPLMLALAPFALPSLALGATTIGGATKLGAAANKAGFIYGNLGTAEAAGSFTYNYRQMRGAAMEALTEEGLSYEDAKPLAHSEALLSSGVELASEVFSVVTLATGKIPGVSKLKDFMGDGIKGVVAGAGDDMLSALGVPQKAASAIKGVVRFGGSYLTSAATEGVEEYIQTDISSANKRIARQIKNAVNGGDVSGLIAETYNVLFRPTKEERAEANESAWEGFKTGLVADGGTGIVIRLANKVDSTIADHRNNIEIGKDIVKNDEQMVALINAIKFGNKATNKYAEKLVKDLYNGNDVNEAQYGKLAKMTAESYEEAMQNASAYTSPAAPTASSYTENKGLNDVLNGLNIKAVDEIVSDANLMNEFAKVSGVNLYSPVNNPKVNGAVKTVANGGDLNSKAINDILNDSNAMNELEEASGVALTRTSGTSIRQSIRDAVGVLAEESPRMAVAQYATTKALARGAVALQSIGYTKTDAENIMSRYAGEQNPEEVAKLMKAVSMLERDIYTNPEYGLGRFASAEKSAEVLGTAVNLMTNPEAVITRQTLEGFAKAFTDSAKQTNSIGYKNIVSALKEYGFEGNDAEVRQLLYNAVYEGKAEYRGKDFSDNRFVSAFADNLKLFTNSTLAFASSNNPNLTPANMQTVIAINKNNWSDVLQITEDSGIIDSKGSGNNGRKILRQAQKRSSSRTDSGTVERVRKEQGQGSDTGRGSRAEEEKRRSKSSSDGRVRQDSERRRLTVGSYEVNYSDGVALNSDDQDIQSYLEARGFTANAITDITLANGTQLEGFTTGKNVYYDANGDKWQITGHELVHALKRVDRKGYEALKNRIIKGIGKKNFNKLVEAYEELYGTVYNNANTNDIVEEIVCDIAGNVMSGIDSIRGFEITDDISDSVNDYLDSAVTDELIEGQSGLISDEAKFLAKDYWTPDLTRTQLKQLNELIRKDIKTSTNQITDTANWYTTRINGMKVFAIYSTENQSNPTLLYESKNSKADVEQKLLSDILEEIENGKSVDGKSEFVMRVLGSNWNSQKHNSSNSVRSVARGRNTGNASVLQRQSSANGSEAFRNVLQSVFGISNGGRGDGGTDVNFKLKSPVEETKDLISLHNLRTEDSPGSFDLGETDEVKFKFSSEMDSEYLELAKNPEQNEARLRELVEDAARNAGYNSPKLYHGTEAFGFTEFDLSKTDDKRTIFLTNNKRIASTYSGVSGEKSISDVYNKNVEKLSTEDIAIELNKFVKEYYKDTFQSADYNYSYYNLEKLNTLISRVNDGLIELKSDVEQKIKEYAEKMALDFDDNTTRTHRQLVALDEKLDKWDYNNLSTPIYLLIHHTDAFKDSSSKYAELEADIRLMNQLRMNKAINDGVVIEESLGRYSIEILSRDEAIEELKSLGNKGNYGLYAKMENPLIVDGRAQNWNNIRHWQDALVSDKKEYELVDDDEYYYLKNKKTGKVIEEANIDILRTEKMSSVDVIDFLLNKYRNILATKYESIHNTRGVAKFANDNGYDSVIIKNITDNGGRNYNVDLQETADIYVVFNSNQLKSADLVTYDDDGNIIPLSERFNTEDNDIRFKAMSESDVRDEIQQEYFTAKESDINHLSEQVDSWLSGNMKSNEHFELGETPFVIIELKAFKLPVVMTQNAMVKITGQKHSVSVDDIKNLPNAIADPVMVFKSATYPNAFVILTEFEDKEGNPVITALHLNKSEKHIKAFVTEQTKLGNLKYIDKNKSQDWSQSRGLQLPKLADTNPDNNIILEKEDIVNTILHEISKSDTFKAKVSEKKKPAATKSNKKNYISKFANTMKVAQLTPDSAKSDFEKQIEKGSFSYMRIDDKSAEAYAKEKIDELGFDGALKRWETISDMDGIPGKKDMALGLVLYNECVNAKDAKNAMKIAVDLATLGTKAGQAVQALGLINKMSADAQLYSLEKSVQFINASLKAGGKKFENVIVKDELAKNYLEATTEEEKTAALDALQTDIANQIPVTWNEKLNAWRYLAMLGNPRTHIRNIIGNAIFVPAIRMKDFIATIIETSIPQDQRTKSIIRNKDAKEFAKEDFHNVEAILRGIEGKYGLTHGILEKRRIYTSRYFKWLEALRKANFAALEKEDTVFLKRAYIDSLSRIMTARKIKADTLRDGSLESANLLEELRAYAIAEAQKATFREFNELASRITQFQKQLSQGSKTAKLASGIIEAALPFKQTPANVLKQGVAYSPLSLVRIITDFNKMKNSRMKSSEYIDNIAKGLTGTALFALGYFLASKMVVTGSGDEDERKGKFDSAYGSQNYAIKIGDYTYTLDWASPMALPLFAGVEYFSIMDEEGFSVGDVLEAMSRISEPVFEMSLLQGVSDIIETVRYSDSNAITAMGTTLATNYLNQFVPTLFGQIARTIDPVSRSYDFNKAENLPSFLRSTTAKTISKIPGASMILEPKLDIWGNEITYGNSYFTRGLQNFFSPGYVRKLESDKVSEHLDELYKSTGNSDIYPHKAYNNFTYNNTEYKLTGSKYTWFAKRYGQIALDGLAQLFESDKYKKMTNTEKEKAIKAVYTDANALAKKEYIRTFAVDNFKFGSDEWYAQDIYDFLVADKYEEAVSAFNIAVEKNKFVIPTKEEANRTEAVKNDVVAQYSNYIEELVQDEISEADGKFNYIYTWTDGFYKYSANAATIEDKKKIEADLKKAGFNVDDGTVSVSKSYNYDYIDGKLANIGAIKPVTHYGTEWYASAFFNNDANAMKTYIENARTDGLTEKQIEGQIKAVVSGEYGIFQKSWRANLESAMDFCDNIVIEVYEDDSISTKDSDRYYFSSVAEMNKRRKEIEDAGYRNGGSGRKYYQVKGYSYTKTGKLSSGYDYSKILDFAEASDKYGTVNTGEWDEKKAYMNYVNPSIINYQPISYAETTATVVSEEAPKVSTNETLGANTPTEGEYTKNETKF